MQYIRVNWLHSFEDEPILLFSELDDNRWEVRKVEVFRDETMGYSARGMSSHGTKLSEVPLPSLTEIAADPQFQPTEISRDEFEEIWDRAVKTTFRNQ